MLPAQVDPKVAVEVAEKLGGANVQTLLAFLFVGSCLMAAFLAWLLWRSWQAHLAEVRACAADRSDLLAKKIEAENSLAKAIDGSAQVTRAALDALKAARP